jgi:hypothetical protein
MHRHFECVRAEPINGEHGHYEGCERRGVGG